MYEVSTKRAGRRIAVCGLLVAGAAVIPVAHATAGANRVETPVASASPITSVVESMVSVRIPLPASDGPHPAACDWLSYLRYRDANGPAQSAQADKILIAQPGIFEGAGAFDSVARDTVAAAAKAGKHIEFWALDRRSNCLEDHTGTQAGAAAGNAHVAVDYYYRNTPIDGHTFAGYLTSDQVGWLADVGIEQTVRDEYDLMVAELPSQQLRKQKVLCGGHSLGGIVTGFFAEWDFDGIPGYAQCSGYFALDSTISTSLGSLSGMPSTSTVGADGLDYTAVQLGLATGVVPRFVALPALINPETMNLLGVAGLAAATNPDGQSDLASCIPADTNLTITYRTLFSQNLVNFLTGSPSIQDFRLTNDAALGALLDDNSMPLAFLESSDGFFDGGGIADKDFPLSSDTINNPSLKGLTGLFGTDPMAIPDQPAGPLYTWRNFDQIGAPGAPVYVDGDGQPYTTAAQEVTDIHELARSLGEQPLDFTEWYFPTKLVTDIDQASAPQIADHLKYPDGITANPTINLLGGSGLVVHNGLPTVGVNVVAPGYHHLDVLTAAPNQNNGQPEPVSTNLAQFAGA
jgi:hypothetical protein